MRSPQRSVEKSILKRFIVHGDSLRDTMEEGYSVARRWEDLDTDILVKIFQSFDIFELTSGIAHVCSAWRLACCDPLLWKTLDLSMLRSNFIKIPLEPYVYVDGRSDKTLTRLLKISLNLSRGNTTSLFFHFNLYVSDDQLTYTAERCPRIRRLVLPAWNRIKKTGICKAIHIWSDLESMIMPSIANPRDVIEEIAKNCKNFRELKILDGLQGLEVLNISHCLLIDIQPPPTNRRIIRQLDETILEKASRLHKFWTCMDPSCIMCQRTKNDEGLMRWYRYEEGLWKADEISSLAF
uniref:Uncharacterized protein MANES_06G146400 n=1 Tax=Rhizophora mucronata TaxID=61149 RepID=A0A2P2KZ89_RHIMU